MAKTPTDLRPDFAAAVKLMKNSYGTKREVRVITEHLDPQETVIRCAGGRRSGQAGLVVLTDRRYMFLWQGLVGSTQESIPLDLITAVSVNKGLIFSVIKTSGTQSMEKIEQVDKTDAGALATELRSRLNQRSASVMVTPSVAEQPPATAPDPMAQIRELKELLDLGAINQDEFESKKNELLARM